MTVETEPIRQPIAESVPTSAFSAVRRGSLENPPDIINVAESIKEGKLGVVNVYGVFGLFADGTQSHVFEQMQLLKGDTDPDRKFSTMMFHMSLAEFIDIDKLLPPFKELLINQKVLHNSVGTMIHLRWPLKTEMVSQVPSPMRSQQNGTWVIHNLEPYGHPVSRLISALYEREITWIAVTTLNKHEEAEKTTYGEAEAFCIASVNQLQCICPTILVDDQRKIASVQGSFPIVDTMTGEIIRDGIIPPEIVQQLLKTQLNTDNMQPAKFPQHEQFDVLASRGYNNPAFLRAYIHLLIQGKVILKKPKELEKLMIRLLE